MPQKAKIAKIASMDSLAKLIKFSKTRSKDAHNYHNSNSKIKYMYLIAPLKVDEIEYIVTMDIRKLSKGRNRFYIHNLTIKNEDNSTWTHSDQLTDESSSKYSIPLSDITVNT